MNGFPSRLDITKGMSIDPIDKVDIDLDYS